MNECTSFSRLNQRRLPLIKSPIMEATLEIYAPFLPYQKVISSKFLPSFVLISVEIAFIKFYKDIQRKVFVL